MKKAISILCCFLLIGGVLFAQEQGETTTKKSRIKELPEGWLPEAGDFSIGIDATPLLEYVGNALNGKTNNTLNDFAGAPYLNTVSDPSAITTGAPKPDVSIMGKYMLTDNLAVRANIGIIVDVYNPREFSTDDLKAITNPTENAKVVDRMRATLGGASIALGAEYRVGKHKVQGIFGGSLFAEFSSVSVTYTYGNAITDINQAPSSNNWGTNLNVGYVPYNASNRVLTDKSRGADSYLGIIGHVGVEWFFAPKVSLGGEVNLSLYGSMFAKRYQIAEAWNPLENKLDKWTEITRPKASGFHFGTENIGANVFVHFYFN